MVVAEQLSAEGLEPFGFFSFTPLGLTMLVLGIGFMVLVAYRMLPARTGDKSSEPDDVEKQAIIKRMGDSAFPAVEKLQHFMAQIQPA